MTDFIPYPKTPRLRREVVITEKLDGTNAAVRIVPTYRSDLGDYSEGDWTFVVVDGQQYGLCAQSRKRVITPEDDNHGFAKWAHVNARGLVETVGEGVHFGEWWGSGVNRGYGLEKGEKRFSLFNVKRWADIVAVQEDTTPVPGLRVVPTLATGVLSDDLIDNTVEYLRTTGSSAAYGFMNPEGIIVFHTQSRNVYKVLLEQDDLPKGLVA